MDPEAVYYWLDVYSKCSDDDVILEFLKSEDFLLSMKNQFDIATFDAEDPQYPDDDNYFLTEDNQLIIEYKENFNQVSELKELIRRLYSDLGVENAYAFLFKMVVDSYHIMEEQNFEEKKNRLRDYGFVDYFDALEYQAPMQSEKQIFDFVKSKKGLTADLDTVSANQTLHASSLTAYQSGLDSLKEASIRLKEKKAAISPLQFYQTRER